MINEFKCCNIYESKVSLKCGYLYESKSVVDLVVGCGNWSYVNCNNCLLCVKIVFKKYNALLGYFVFKDLSLEVFTPKHFSN